VDQKSSYFEVPHHHTLLPYIITSGIEYTGRKLPKNIKLDEITTTD